MPSRRALGVVVVMLAGCDTAGRAEVAALRAELASRSALESQQQARIDALSAELAQVRAERERCEAEKPRPIAPEPDPQAKATTSGPTLTATCAAGVCAVSRAEFEALLADSASLVRLARIVPVLEGEAMTGIKLFAIRPGSPLAAVGLQNGDVVRTFAGVEIRSLEALMGAARDLGGRERWAITGVRKDSPFELTIELK